MKEFTIFTMASFVIGLSALMMALNPGHCSAECLEQQGLYKSVLPDVKESQVAFDKFVVDMERLEMRLGKRFFPVDLTSNRNVYRYVNDSNYDDVSIRVKPSADCYLYVISLNADGKAVCLYPFGKCSDDEQYALVKAGQEVQIPNPASNLRFAIREPLGSDIIIVIARSKKYDFKTKSYRDEVKPILDAVREAKEGVETIRTLEKSIIAYAENMDPKEIGVKALMIQTVKVKSRD